MFLIYSRCSKKKVSLSFVAVDYVLLVSLRLSYCFIMKSCCLAVLLNIFVASLILAASDSVLLPCDVATCYFFYANVDLLFSLVLLFYASSWTLDKYMTICFLPDC